MTLEQTLAWALDRGLPHEFRPQDNTLTVQLPSEQVEAELATFNALPDSNYALLTLGDLESGWGMILRIPIDGKIRRLHQLLDSLPKPITLASFAPLREAVMENYPNTVDRAQSDD
ncbi:hypothetical protein [Micromonospora haikouensis]|uniref:hypothetical protein n=1 Tax=Micromonospora haikouensis TaxID=686309 RepID=UPI003D8C6897